MAHVLNGSQSFTCTPRVHPLTECSVSAFAFPAETGKIEIGSSALSVQMKRTS